MGAKKAVFVGIGGGPQLGLETIGLCLEAVKYARNSPDCKTLISFKGTENPGGSPMTLQQKKTTYKPAVSLLETLYGNLAKKEPANINVSHMAGYDIYKSPGYAQTVEQVRRALAIYEGTPNWKNIGKYTVIQTSFIKQFIDRHGLVHKVGWRVGANSAGPANRKELIEWIIRNHKNELYFDWVYNIAAAENCWKPLSASYVQAAKSYKTGMCQAPYTITAKEQGWRPVLGQSFAKFCKSIPQSYDFKKALARTKKLVIEPFKALYPGSLVGNSAKQEVAINQIDEIQNLLLEK